jgi:hypothetical protein
MRHHWQETEKELQVGYQWKIGSEWNYLNVSAEKVAIPIRSGSEEEFITEHYWGYTKIGPALTGEYQVTHPKWMIHQVNSFEITCDTKKLYGEGFVNPLAQKPHSVFLAAGSPIQVMEGNKVLIRSQPTS